MSLTTDLSKRFADAYESLGLDPAGSEVVRSQRPELAQFQNNGAMTAAKARGAAPRDLAQAIIDAIDDRSPFTDLSVAGPGFINITVDDGFLAGYTAALSDDERVGVPIVDDPLTVVVDYGGPNLSKSLHVGHLRAAIIGESLKRLFRFVGHRVFGDIHMGDWGMPVGQLIIELEDRDPTLPYFDRDSTGGYPDESPVTLDELSDMYPVITARAAADPDVAERARRATFELQRGRPGYVALWQHFRDTSVAGQRQDFDALGVAFDLYWGRVRSSIESPR